MKGPSDPGKETFMLQYLWIVAILVGWILLQVWILPKLGVST